MTPDDGPTPLALRKTGPSEGSPTLLFVHGLGDSSAAFAPLLEHPRLAPCRMLAPDLAGFGASRHLFAEPEDAAFAVQTRRLLELLAREQTGGDLVLVGHSMGGSIATLLAALLERGSGRELLEQPELGPLLRGQDPGGLARLADEALAGGGEGARWRPGGLVNIEGNLTASDAFFSGRTVQADRRGGFERFFRRFVATTRSGPWAQANPATAHYGAELERCEPRAFLAAAHELVNWTTPLDTDWSPMQRLYAGLQLPRIYLHGTRDQGRETLEWLDEANLERAPLEGAGHWVMNEEPDLVATLLATLANAWI